MTRRDSDPGGPDGLREDLVLSVRRFGVVPVVIAEGTVDLRTGPQLAHVITGRRRPAAGRAGQLDRRSPPPPAPHATD